MGTQAPRIVLVCRVCYTHADMSQPIFSIVIPAYDEEHFLPKCLDAIDRAAGRLGEPVEVIVADNASRDRTADIARERGARVVRVEEKCLAIIRNRGAAQATGKYVAFIDADTFMSDNMLVEVKRVMDSGRYVGGGVARVKPDRYSFGMLCSAIAFSPVMMRAGVSAVMFYTTLESFRAIGGFNETLYAVEDLDFGRRLKQYGKTRGMKYKNLWRASVTTSTRKLDEYGDWFIIRHPLKVIKLLRNDPEEAYDFWYRPRR